MKDPLVYGLHAVLAAVRSHPERVEAVWLMEGRSDKRIAEVEKAAHAASVPLRRANRDELDRMVDGLRHQGAVARLRPGAESAAAGDFDVFLAELPAGALLLVLDGVQDPHNLGACLRSADAAGVHAVIVPKDNSAPLSAVARNVASGAAESVPLYRVTNLARALRGLKEQGVWLIGAADDASATLFEADLTGPTALVLGGEGPGLRRLTREECDLLVHIPMAGTVSSLNVSVAAGVCLFEAVRQRKVASSKPRK
jgi:23S rRNA (guanosine2251-2'-O)-methyltransferase